MKKNYLLITGILILLIVGGYFGVQKFSDNKNTVTIENENFITDSLKEEVKKEKINKEISHENKIDNNNVENFETTNKKDNSIYSQEKNISNEETIIFSNQNKIFTKKEIDNEKLIINKYKLEKLNLLLEKSISIDYYYDISFFENGAFLIFLNKEDVLKKINFYDKNLDFKKKIVFPENYDISGVRINNNYIDIFGNSKGGVIKVIDNSGDEILLKKYQNNIVDSDISLSGVASVLINDDSKFKLIYESFEGHQKTLFLNDPVLSIKFIDKDLILINGIKKFTFININTLDTIEKNKNTIFENFHINNILDSKKTEVFNLLVSEEYPTVNPISSMVITLDNNLNVLSKFNVEMGIKPSFSDLNNSINIKSSNYKKLNLTKIE